MGCKPKTKLITYSYVSIAPPSSIHSSTNTPSPRLWFLALFCVSLFGMLRVHVHPLLPRSTYPCTSTSSSTSHYSRSPSFNNNNNNNNASAAELFNGQVQSRLLLKVKEGEEFWEQPNGLGYRPCLKFSEEYNKGSERILKNNTRTRRKYLVVVVSGGLNQQRNQIVDAVVIARILEAILVVPILQVNPIWGDESEFSDIFVLEHFKKVLSNDVHVISSLPSTHIRTRPVVEKQTPLHVSAAWIRARYTKRLEKEGVLLLRGLDSRLSKDLPPDLQKLRCKVAFNALKFALPILKLGNKLAERIQKKGPYLALHLRMEKDVWVRTGCLPGLSPKYDELVNSERRQHPQLLTGRSNMTYHERKLAGLCPLNAMEVTRLLKALGAPKNARIFWAGGEPLGGKEALQPLTKEFPNFFNKEDIALPGELEPFANKASSMAAIDYIICERSNVFMPSHGGNMGGALQGQRTYAGHKKYITPNKRHMLPFFLNPTLSDVEFNRIMKEQHKDSLGQPELRKIKIGRDVTKYPIPDCMCNDSISR